MHIDRHHLLVADFEMRRSDAEEHLLREMTVRGLSPADGWWIAEFIRETPDGMEWVMRPMHASRDAPPDLECIVKLLLIDASVASSCSPRSGLPSRV